MNASKIQFIRPHVIATNAIVDTKLIRWIDQLLPTLPITPVAAIANNRRTQSGRIPFPSIQWIIYFRTIVRVMAEEMLTSSPPPNNEQTMHCIEARRTLILTKLMIFVNDTQTNALAHWIARCNYRKMWTRCHRRHRHGHRWSRWDAAMSTTTTTTSTGAIWDGCSIVMLVVNWRKKENVHQTKLS